MTIFEKIAKGEIPAKIIWQDDDFIAFLDINPVGEAHTLVIPKENWGDYIFDLDDYKYRKLMDAAKEVSKLLKRKIDCERIVMWVEGFEIEHVHIHLLPAKNPRDFQLEERKEVSSEDLDRIYKKIVD